MRQLPLHLIVPEDMIYPEKLIDYSKPIDPEKFIDPDPLFLFGHLNALPPSKKGVFDSSNPLKYRQIDNPNPSYFPFPWGEKRWKEWMETPMSKSADQKKVTFLDQPGSLDFKNRPYWCGPLNSALKPPPNPLTRNDDPLTANVFHNEWLEYVRNTVKKPKRSFRSALHQALETRPTARKEAVVEPASESQEEAPVKRVHWCDTDNVDHHVYLKPVAELLVKPGAGYGKRAAAWVKTALRLPTYPPAASPFKSCLKRTSRPKQEQIDEPADTHTLTHTPPAASPFKSCQIDSAIDQPSLTHTPPPDVPSTTLQHCDIPRMFRPTGNGKAIKIIKPSI